MTGGKNNINNILCVEFCPSVTRMALVKQSSVDNRVLKICDFATPNNRVCYDNYLSDIGDEVVLELKNKILSNNMQADYIAFSVNTYFLEQKVIRFSEMSDNKLQSTDEQSAKEIFKSKSHEAKCFAQKRVGGEVVVDVFRFLRGTLSPTSKYEIYPWEKIADKLGMQCVGLVDSMYSIIKEYNNEFKYRSNSLMIHLEENLTGLALIGDDGHIIQMEKFYRGLRDLIDTVYYHLNEASPNLNFTTHDALINMSSVDFLNRPALREDVRRLQKLIESNANRLIENIEKQAIDITQKHNVCYSQIVLTGIGADIAWLKDAIERHFGVPIRIITSIDDKCIVPSQNDSAFNHACLACACAANQSANLINRSA